MRIAIWTNLPPGGAKRAMFDHIRGLVERGHHVEIWTPEPDAGELFPLAELATEHVVPLTAGRPPWWSHGRLSQLRSPRRIIAGHRAHARACAAEITAGDFDICLAGTCPTFGSPPLGRYLQMPSALYLQEPHRWLYEAAPEFPWLQGPTPLRKPLEAVRIQRRSQRARFEVDNAHAFDRVLVNSLFSREALLRCYGLDSQVCYLGVDTRVFRPTGAERENVVLGVGSPSTQKRALLLTEAVALMPAPRPRLVWLGAGGDDNYVREVEEAARRGDVDLTIRRDASDDDLVDAYNRARVLVYAPRLEPFGLVPLEAGACKLPVVAVAEGGVRETVTEGVNGLMASPTPDAIAAAIGRVCDDPALAARLGEGGRRTVEERWTLERATDRIERALAAISSAPRGGGATSDTT